MIESAVALPSWIFKIGSLDLWFQILVIQNDFQYGYLKLEIDSPKVAYFASNFWHGYQDSLLYVTDIQYWYTVVKHYKKNFKYKSN